MKRYGNLFSKIYDLENLRQAHLCARKDKLFYEEVKLVDGDLDFYLEEIQRALKSKTYKIISDDYNVCTINDKGKERELWKLPYYPHRIIQWAIALQVEPIFTEVFCYHTCASLKNRGMKRASRLTEQYMRCKTDSMYCLKIDIAKFYPNIDHEILKRLLRRKFKDDELLELLDMIIDSYPGEKGVPIGSYLSQFLANYYLAYFDHWMKEEMRIKRVVRYMDDIIVLHHSKEFLHWLLLQMDDYLSKNLKLRIKSNWQIFPTGIRGIDFVGYRFFYGYKLLRKGTCKRFKRQMRKIREKYERGQKLNYHDWCSANSYAGWLIWCDSWRLCEKYLVLIIPALLLYYGEVIKRNTQRRKWAVAFNRYKTKLLQKKGRVAA